MFNEEDKAYILKNFTEDALIKKRLNTSQKINKQEGWDKIKSKINIPVRRFNWSYSVAAVLLLAILIGYFIKYPLNNASVLKKTTKNAIEIGSNKAILTLEDGTKVALEKGNTFKTNIANSNGEQITYLSNNTNKSEITYNALTIPRGGQFFLELSDGTKVWLNSESQLKYPTSFINGKDRKVELIYGEAYFEVTPSSAHQGAAFIVSNAMQDIQVMGTSFNVKAYKDEAHIYTTLVEGKVSVLQENTTEYLLPSQQYVLNKNTKIANINMVDTKTEISWKDGIFSFDSLPLKKIMKVLSRWYDLEIIFLNKATEEEEFIGVLSKNQKLEDILSIIKSFNILESYEIQGNTVTLK